jgi:hypothetical protein
MATSYNSPNFNARPLPRRVRLLMLLNAAFGAAVLSAWTYVAVFLAEPIAWATWIRVYKSGNLLIDFFEYPFFMLWAVPLGAICGAWVAVKARMNQLAFSCALFPLLGLSLVVTWYHLAPPEWR